ncbi:MAG: 12,18-didecarboxysiroheme deacetylase [Caldimicrobium sp.]|nr:12,18-didecarboxysiroheme deacetylase [Caldimicrobium sp.]MCX7613010.1 12,18-didecarboxysiroheme deacetylase [Caldimicrobium sp.]MDW8182287.1 12,18-didecarboxysiroheme deacetylase [Caldimicrobium sp.]
MIGISKLYCGTVEASDPLRYGRRAKDLPSHLLQFSVDKKPVVVWNVTRACNLRCIHCYASADNNPASNELTTEEGFRLLEDLANFGCPVVLFSGGEPLVRADLFDLINKAVTLGLRAVLSTNGTLIDEVVARELKKFGLSYVGISLDGIGEVHDRFRVSKGCFDKVVKAIENCKREGIKVGLRFTINKFNAGEIPKVFDFVEEISIPRICFYHLVYAGRGSNLVEQDLSHEETRKWVDYIIDRTKELHDKGHKVEVLTVDNHADGPYLYLRMKREGNPRAEEVYQLLLMNGGNNTGVGIGCVSWDGEVHPDQFWRHYSFGNVRKRPFSEIWMDTSDPLMAKLKEKKRHVKGRCAQCRFLEICGGNFRVRAEAVTGDVWAPDPACFLTDEEIGILC